MLTFENFCARARSILAANPGKGLLYGQHGVDASVLFLRGNTLLHGVAKIDGTGISPGESGDVLTDDAWVASEGRWVESTAAQTLAQLDGPRFVPDDLGAFVEPHAWSAKETLELAGFYPRIEGGLLVVTGVIRDAADADNCAEAREVLEYYYAHAREQPAELLSD